MILFCPSFFSLPLILCMAFLDQEICTESFFKSQQGLSVFFIFFSPWLNCGLSDINYSNRQFGLLWQAWVAFFACLQSAVYMRASDWCLLLESWAWESALCSSSQPCSVITDPLPSNSETDKTQAVWALACRLWGSSFTSGVTKAKLRQGQTGSTTGLPPFPPGTFLAHRGPASWSGPWAPYDFPQAHHDQVCSPRNAYLQGLPLLCPQHCLEAADGAGLSRFSRDWQAPRDAA